LQPGSGQLHARLFAIGADLSFAESRFAGFVEHNSGQLPLEPSAAMRRAALPAEHAARRTPTPAREHAAEGAHAAYSEPGAPSLSAEGFPEPSAVHWRLLASLLIVAGWAMQLVADWALPRVNKWLS
jgi:hypothetical protein